MSEAPYREDKYELSLIASGKHGNEPLVVYTATSIKVATDCGKAMLHMANELELRGLLNSYIGDMDIAIVHIINTETGKWISDIKFSSVATRKHNSSKSKMIVINPNRTAHKVYPDNTCSVCGEYVDEGDVNCWACGLLFEDEHYEPDMYDRYDATGKHDI